MPIYYPVGGVTSAVDGLAWAEAGGQLISVSKALEVATHTPNRVKPFMIFQLAQKSGIQHKCGAFIQSAMQIWGFLHPPRDHRGVAETMRE